MTTNWRDEFSPSKICPIHPNPTIFITSQWQLDQDKPSIMYLFVRLVIFITFFVLWLLAIILQTATDRPFWIIYMTNWGFTLCMVQSCMSCVLLTGAVCYWKNIVDKMYPIYWVLHVISITAAFTITLVYWTLIFGAEGGPFNTMNFMVHAFNSILMFIDFWFVAHPVHILHFCYPVLFAIIYAIMTVIYYACGGLTERGSPYIYLILKWDQPDVTMGYIMGIMVIMIIMHMLTYFMFKLRTKISPPIRALIHKKLFTRSDGPYV